MDKIAEKVKAKEDKEDKSKEDKLTE